MIVQCEACQTRFRLADEKIKPGGTKVRCSRCKEVFTVTLPEPQPVEEAVDYGSFNMEKIDETPAAAAHVAAGLEEDSAEATEQPAADATAAMEAGDREESGETDFNPFAEEVVNDTVADEQRADDFLLSETSLPAENERPEGADLEFEEEPGQEQTGFESAFAESAETGGPVEFDFGEEPGTAHDFAGKDEPDFPAEESEGLAEFSFSDAGESGDQEPGEFTLDEDSGDGAFSFDESAATSPAATEEYHAADEFSFEDDNPFGEDSATEWSDTAATTDTSFDFEEPRFDSDDSSTPGDAANAAKDGMQFGEIDFANDTAGSEPPGHQAEHDFSRVTMANQEEPEPVKQRQPSPPPPPPQPRDLSASLPPKAPSPAKKSPLSRLLLLLVLLLVALGGAAGFLYMQEGSLKMSTVVRYLPFLQDYLGETPPASPGDRIAINIIGSSYVNGQAGQMLVIQGTAVNNYPTTRSAITIKGLLLDAKGSTLRQQTVFCGNRLDDEALQTMSFAAIEEAMNNQFGDSLSNMNVAAGASIPFTIVFRNLPADIASINVEVADSKPGAG